MLAVGAVVLAMTKHPWGWGQHLSGATGRAGASGCCSPPSCPAPCTPGCSLLFQVPGAGVCPWCPRGEDDGQEQWPALLPGRPQPLPARPSPCRARRGGDRAQHHQVRMDTAGWCWQGQLGVCRALVWVWGHGQGCGASSGSSRMAVGRQWDMLHGRDPLLHTTGPAQPRMRPPRSCKEGLPWLGGSSQLPPFSKAGELWPGTRVCGRAGCLGVGMAPEQPSQSVGRKLASCCVGSWLSLSPLCLALTRWGCVGSGSPPAN